MGGKGGVEVEVWVVRVEMPHSISPHPTARSPSIVREIS